MVVLETEDTMGGIAQPADQTAVHQHLQYGSPGSHYQSSLAAVFNSIFG